MMHTGNKCICNNRFISNNTIKAWVTKFRLIIIINNQFITHSSSSMAISILINNRTQFIFRDTNLI